MKNQEPNKEVFVDGAWKLIDIKGNLVGYTSLCCDKSTAKDNPTYPVPATAIFIFIPPY